VLAAVLLSAALHAAGEVLVRAEIGGVAIPGATVVATQGEKRIVSTTDEDGRCVLTLDDGVWTLQIAMRGFVTVVREATVGSTPSAPIDVKMSLAPAGELSSSMSPATPPPDGTSGMPPSPSDTAVLAPDAAADGLVVNGSTYNAAASPFAQPPAFGNYRPGARSLFTGSLALMGGNSAWDARPYSFVGQPAPAPDYADVQVAGTFGGPVKMPFLRGRRVQLTASVQRSVTTSANAVRTRVPTALERAGDFSASPAGTGTGRPILDPATGVRFPGDTIPAERLSPQALALLSYYPEPNVTGVLASNYETNLADKGTRSALQLRLATAMTTRQQVSASVAYQRGLTDSTSLFHFSDRHRTSDLDAAVTWSYHWSAISSMRARYELVRGLMETTPFFADRVDVSGEAGIGGNDRSPASWGPPNLAFASGLAGLTSAAPAARHTRAHLAGADLTWLRGHHNITLGGEWRPRRVTSASLADPRGTFTFTGSATGDDFADFLLGRPHASSISFGDARTFFGASAAAFLTDDWHPAPALTIDAGARWEYESPFREQEGRLANLDLAPAVSAAALVTPESAVGAVTGSVYPATLIEPDRGGLEPRIGVSWRPLAASSLIVRGGYGIYRQSEIYLPIALWLAAQPPFSTAASLESTAERPLTLANGLASAPDRLRNTVAVDPHLRAGFAETWQLSLERDLPGSLTVAVSYLGTRGHHLLQESLPNTVPPGADQPCPACPSGFIYISSEGTSSRHALQVQVRRRLRNGLGASMQYTLTKAIDNATALAGASASGSSIAQDWTHLDTERGPSTFDRRHLLTAEVEYTTGVGTAGGGLLTGWRGRLVKGWVLAGELSVGSGLPVTPVSLTSVPGTGVTGTIRASTVPGAAPAPAGAFINPAAYVAPAPGQWGTAGRNSARGPASFSLDASLSRSFPIHGERSTLEWRLDATNVLNRVTFVDVDALVGSPEFGLPDRTSQMRKLRMTLRWRF
jgi:hypothetical protein